MKEKTFIRVYNDLGGTGGDTGSLLALYQPKRGAKVLGVNVWCSLIPDFDWFKPPVSLPKLSVLNSESENEYLIQAAERKSSAVWVNLYLGKPGLPSSQWDEVYKEADPSYFTKLAGYSFQAYKVPQEVDLLSEARGEMPYVNIEAGSGLYIRATVSMLDSDLKNRSLNFDGGDVPKDEQYGFSKFIGSRETRAAYCWGDRITIFGSAWEYE